MSDSQRAPSKVTLEDLLRVKRAERPPPEFWAEFERSLRAKQLAAIVEKRPWWRSFTGLSRWSLPVGAAAALTVSFAVVGHFRTKPAATVASATDAEAPRAIAPQIISAQLAVASVVATPAQESDALAQVAETPPAVAQVASHSEAAPTIERPETSTAAAPVDLPARAVRVASITERVAGVSAPERDVDNATSTAALTADTSRAASSFGSLTSAFQTASASLTSSGEFLRTAKSASVEPLAKLQNPRETRRERMLAYVGTVDTRTPQYSNSTNVIRSRERIASHLNEDAIYDSIRRLGVRNGGLSIQF